MSDRQTETHPSFGAIRASRVSGFTHLFDSPFTHQHYVIVEISHAEMNYSHGVNSENIWPTKQIVEVAMSETQFARFITSLNAGCGTACTITDLAGKRVPHPEADDIVNRHKSNVKAEVAAKMESCQGALKQLEDLIESKKRPTLAEVKELHNKLSLIVSHLGSNLEFFNTMMHEKMDTIVNEGKTEIDAYVHAAVQRAGMLALAEQQKPALLLEVSNVKGAT